MKEKDANESRRRLGSSGAKTTQTPAEPVIDWHGSQSTQGQVKRPDPGAELSGNRPVIPDTGWPTQQIFLDEKMIIGAAAGDISDRFEKKPRLGALLMKLGTVSEELLCLALKHQKSRGLRLGEALVELNVITEEVMRRALCLQLKVPFIRANSIHVEADLRRLFNRSYAQRHGIVPLAKRGRTVTLIMDDPTDEQLIDELEARTGFTLKVVSSTRAGILDAFNRVYEHTEVAKSDSRVQVVHEENPKTQGASKYLAPHGLGRADSLVTALIGVALRNSASDIHIETTDRRLDIRFRIDGVLQELYLGPLEDELNRLQRETVSRIKILGNLDIAERRRPQDGSFRVRLVKRGKEAKIDFRISIVQGYYGENIVLRVLDNRKAPKSIDELDLSRRINQKLHELLKRTTGILLVTGPTGSGKSTTLYGALMTCYRPGIKILTAEDPIEYVYDKITQCEVNARIGNTFARFIRAFLRQDPEIIMVGEIRDSETAEMAFRAAQTGHLVLSTLHTNDAVSSITRLLDLNVDPSLIASCLLGALSQRLVRQVCPHCKSEYQPKKELLKTFFDVTPKRMRWFKGKGCSQCNHTGYHGRMAVTELWIPTDNDIILINKGAGIDELRRSSHRSTIFMAEDAIQKLEAGKTNLEEFARTLPFSSVSQFRDIGT